MAHSIKSMAASLSYDSVSELAHVLEDRLGVIRSAGRVSGGDELSLLFKGLEGLERMVETVRESGEPPPVDAALMAALAEPAELASAMLTSAAVVAADEAKKKVLRSM
jgi:chemotaxis protein histidine kinase CheA